MGAEALRYPFAHEPEPGSGEAVEIAPGVLWLRMPLAPPLRFINVWALAEPDGWAIIDTGVRSEPTMHAWQRAFEGCLQGRPVTRVIVTHMHPDHAGMAGWIAERSGVQLWMSRLEYLTCRLLSADTGRSAPAEGIEFYRAAGWTRAELERYQERFGFFGTLIYPLPAAYRRIADRERLRFAAHEWSVLIGTGHSPEHACLYCASLKLLISGDQVLPRISSNVSVYPTEPEADPLADWLASLARLKQCVPDEVLVLPSHNSPFHGLHARLDELLQEHRGNLERLLARLETPQRAVDVFDCLFSRRISSELLGMATGEALAHLNHLHAQGLAQRQRDAHGVWLWQRVPRQGLRAS